ncbi:MAG: hypothetical protein LBB91_00625 [Clostridiales bacterium]|nr:hypothetical protein [Clostridiales bacterium]
MIPYVKRKVQLFFNDQRGDVSVKGIAITVGAIVIIGFIALWLASDSGPLQGWITTGGDEVWSWIKDLFGVT